MANRKEQEATVNNGGVTEAQIDQWRAKHRKISEIEIQDGSETHKGYFHRPDMETLSAVSKMSKTDEIKAANVLFENCWLGGSLLLREDAVLKMAAIGILNSLMQVSRVEVKNL